MGIFGLTWSDAAALVGGALGGALLGPSGAMLGAAVGSFAGAELGDHANTGHALTGALAAGLGAAGGAWAGDLTGKLLNDGLDAVAGSALRNGAGKFLLPWNKYDAGLPAALGGLAGAHQAAGTSEPARMTTPVIPSGLSPHVDQLYRSLPGYLGGIWQGFGTHRRPQPTAPSAPVCAPPAAPPDPLTSYHHRAARLHTRASQLMAADSDVTTLAQHAADACGEMIKTCG